MASTCCSLVLSRNSVRCICKACGTDHQYALGCRVLAGLDQQRRNQNGIRRLCLRQIVRDLFTNQRVQQCFKPSALLGVGKDQVAQCAAVELPVGLQHLRAKVFAQFRASAGRQRPSAPHDRRPPHVCPSRQSAWQRRFATTDTAGKPENPGFGGWSHHVKPKPANRSRLFDHPRAMQSSRQLPDTVQGSGYWSRPAQEQQPNPCSGPQQ